MIPRFLSGILFATLLAVAYQQSLTERFKQRSIEFEKSGLAEPFKGVTAKGEVEAGLFPVHSTGVSTEASRKTAAAFAASLNDEQRKKTMFGSTIRSGGNG